MLGVDSILPEYWQRWMLEMKAKSKDKWPYIEFLIILGWRMASPKTNLILGGRIDGT